MEEENSPKGSGGLAQVSRKNLVDFKAFTKPYLIKEVRPGTF